MSQQTDRVEREEAGWFREPCDECGSAFSLRVRGRLYQEQSPFQHIEVYDTTDFGHLLVIDGFIMLSARDNFLYHEMLVHPALCCHPAPTRVVIIGGGDCGSLREVLRHPVVGRVTQIDIDERVTRVSERFFPELCEANQDPRASLLFEDGIQWMRDAATESLDVIIVDSTDPIGPGEVLFSRDFYAACQRALAPGGILVQQSESPLFHQDILRRMREDMMLAGFDNLRSLFFPQPVYPGGWWSATLAGKARDLIAWRDPGPALDSCRYYTQDTHRAAFAMPPFLLEALAGSSG